MTGGMRDGDQIVQHDDNISSRIKRESSGYSTLLATNLHCFYHHTSLSSPVLLVRFFSTGHRAGRCVRGADQPPLPRRRALGARVGPWRTNRRTGTKEEGRRARQKRGRRGRKDERAHDFGSDETDQTALSDYKSSVKQPNCWSRASRRQVESRVRAGAKDGCLLLGRCR